MVQYRSKTVGLLVFVLVWVAGCSDTPGSDPNGASASPTLESVIVTPTAAGVPVAALSPTVSPRPTGTALPAGIPPSTPSPEDPSDWIDEILIHPGGTCFEGPLTHVWVQDRFIYGAGYLVREVQWTADGSRIVFDHRVVKSERLYSVRADDGTRISKLAEGSTEVSFEYFSGDTSQAADLAGTAGMRMSFDTSPDGSRIVYSTCTYTTEIGSRLCYKPSDIRKYLCTYPTRVPGSSGSDNPYEDWIADIRKYQYELAIADIDGSNPRRLTENGDGNNFPRWSLGHQSDHTVQYALGIDPAPTRGFMDPYGHVQDVLREATFKAAGWWNDAFSGWPNILFCEGSCSNRGFSDGITVTVRIAGEAECTMGVACVKAITDSRGHVTSNRLLVEHPTTAKYHMDRKRYPVKWLGEIEKDQEPIDVPMPDGTTVKMLGFYAPSVLMHEFGHTLGMDDLKTELWGYGFMMAYPHGRRGVPDKDKEYIRQLYRNEHGGKPHRH